MVSVKIIASYIYHRYLKEFGVVIDEMKLHKLLYFSQRESFVILDEPMFPELFKAWKYGPVMLEIRDLYRAKAFEVQNNESLAKYKDVFDFVFSEYAQRNSWDLSMLTHGEASWKNARGNTPIGENCSNDISTDDIKLDASRIKFKRFCYEQLNSNFVG